jgi:hypothetical protein
VTNLHTHAHAQAHDHTGSRSNMRAKLCPTILSRRRPRVWIMWGGKNEGNLEIAGRHTHQRPFF